MALRHKFLQPRFPVACPKQIPGPCRSPHQSVNKKTDTSYLLYIKQCDSSIHTAMFITVTCSEMFYHCKNESLKLDVCGCEYFRICVPANSRTFNLNLQGLPGPKSFSKTFPDGKFYTKIPGLSRKHGNLYNFLFFS